MKQNEQEAQKNNGKKGKTMADIQMDFDFGDDFDGPSTTMMVATGTTEAMSETTDGSTEAVEEMMGGSMEETQENTQILGVQTNRDMGNNNNNITTSEYTFDNKQNKT